MIEMIYREVFSILPIAAISMVIVFIAMSVDLIAGLYKARLANVVRTSEAMKRTVFKFILYEGSMLLATGVDTLLIFSRLFNAFGLETFFGVPVITCILGIFIVCVEAVSVFEKSSSKKKKEVRETLEVLEKIRRVIKDIKDEECDKN